MPEHCAEQKEENFGGAEQIAPGEAPGLLGEPVQPFQAVTAHPERGAGGSAGGEFQRGTDAEADAGGRPAQADGIGQQFLHRRAQGDEGKGGAAGAGKVLRRIEARWVLKQVHRRLVVQEMDFWVARGQRRDGGRAHADDRDGGAVQPRQQGFREIGAGDHRWPGEAQPVRTEGDELGIQDA